MAGSVSASVSLEAVEAVESDWVGESLAPGSAVLPHVVVPRGMLALVSYAPNAAGLEERTEVWRPGQVVPETLGGGYWSFARGTFLRVI